MDNNSATPSIEGSSKGTVVSALTPLLAIAASWISGVAAKHIPGANLDPTQVTAVMIATITAVIGVALKWLHGWQRHEARVVAGAASPVTPLVEVGSFQGVANARSAL
jgi:hypothetical protein